MGGAKVKDKISIIKNMLENVNKMIITGGMAFTFLKQMNNSFDIGKSIYDSEGASMVNEIIAKAKEKNVEIILPEDFVCSRKIDDSEATSIYSVKDNIPSDQLGIDVGPNSRAKFNRVINSAKTIFLNGASGVFESKIGREGSIDLVNVII